MIFFQRVGTVAAWIGFVLCAGLDVSCLASSPAHTGIPWAQVAAGLGLQAGALTLIASMGRLGKAWLGDAIENKINWFPLLLGFAVPSLVMGAIGSTMIRGALHWGG